MRTLLLTTFIVVVMISGCRPSEADIQRAIAQTQAAYTPTPSFTRTPVPTNTRKATNTPRATNTPKPSLTPVVGKFRFPLHIGDSITLEIIPKEYRKDPSRNGGEVEFKLLEVKRGEDAKAEAQNLLGYRYHEPMNDQEYIAARGFLNMLSSLDNNMAQTLSPYWHLTLRYEDGGRDTWSVDPILKAAEGYPPLAGEFWILFLVRENSKPLLYFQPNLIVMEQNGIRTLGVYFDLFGQP